MIDRFWTYGARGLLSMLFLGAATSAAPQQSQSESVREAEETGDIANEVIERRKHQLQGELRELRLNADRLCRREVELSGQLTKECREEMNLAKADHDFSKFSDRLNIECLYLPSGDRPAKANFWTFRLDLTSKLACYGTCAHPRPISNNWKGDYVLDNVINEKMGFANVLVLFKDLSGGIIFYVKDGKENEGVFDFCKPSDFTGFSRQ